MASKSLMAGRKRTTELVDVTKLMSSHGADPVMLYQISGPGRPRRFRLPPLAETLIGRDEECLIVLDDRTVSRRHAKIVFSDRKAEIVDLSGIGGTTAERKANRNGPTAGRRPDSDRGESFPGRDRKERRGAFARSRRRTSARARSEHELSVDGHRGNAA